MADRIVLFTKDCSERNDLPTSHLRYPYARIRDEESLHVQETLGPDALNNTANNAESAWRLAEIFASNGSTKRKAVLTIQMKALDKTEAKVNGKIKEVELAREESKELKEGMQRSDDDQIKILEQLKQQELNMDVPRGVYGEHAEKLQQHAAATVALNLDDDKSWVLTST
ncbi:hypothetical protein BJX99DRAFT_256221 [Aspergillus californicus]